MCASTFCCGQSSKKPVLGATYKFLANIDFKTPLLARLGSCKDLNKLQQTIVHCACILLLAMLSARPALAPDVNYIVCYTRGPINSELMSQAMKKGNEKNGGEWLVGRKKGRENGQY